MNYQTALGVPGFCLSILTGPQNAQTESKQNTLIISKNTSRAHNPQLTTTSAVLPLNERKTNNIRSNVPKANKFVFNEATS